MHLAGVLPANRTSRSDWNIQAPENFLENPSNIKGQLGRVKVDSEGHKLRRSRFKLQKSQLNPIH